MEVAEAEMRERMSGNICRCSAYPNIVAAILDAAGKAWRMSAFTYERPADMAAALVAIGQPGAKFIAGGTNLLDLMKLEIETPQHLVDVSRLPLARIRGATAGCASAPW